MSASYPLNILLFLGGLSLALGERHRDYRGYTLGFLIFIVGLSVFSVSVPLFGENKF